MPQSLAKVYIHCIFSTKNGEKWISEPYRKELQAYFIGTISKLGSFTEEIYLNEDHAHILCTLPRTITMAELISKMKTAATKWMKSKGNFGFSWQGGYGVFSVSNSKVPTVSKYIQNQKEHHKNTSFKDEFRLFLNEYNVKFDEKYIWD